MFLKNTRALAPLLGLVVVLAVLSGCGSNFTDQGSAAPGVGIGNQPDSLRITIIRPDSTPGKEPRVTLRVEARVQQLYRILLALPPMPENIACPADLGPHYDLTFLRGTQTVAHALAQHDGCGAVTISGEKGDRKASQDFWSQLDQDIAAATPATEPQSLAIQHTLEGNRPVQTARVTNSAATQRLYHALLALPQATGNCTDAQYPEYQLVFQARDQAIPAQLNQTCNTISLNGNYKSPSGTYTLTDQFKQLFTQTLASTTFAPAQPDQLLQSINGGDTVSHGQVTDAQLMRQLYARIFTLQSGGTIGPDCPSDQDKINKASHWYTFEFSQWGLPIMKLSVFEGTCKIIQPAPGIDTDQTLLGDVSFWNLIHRAAKS
ncbi:MAG TPA: hypothetical protein VF458_19805 [Ktedonobacteraceae bacterium]